MLKKLIMFMGAAALALSLSACGGGPTQSVAVLESASSGITQESVEDTGYEDNLEGLCGYLSANKAIAGDPVEMSYKEIGAIAGCRYSFRFGGSTIQAEFYEFDLDNLDQKGKECVDSVQTKGFFTILGNEVHAQLNGKYLMIYVDKSREDANIAHTAQVEELFLGFKQ